MEKLKSRKELRIKEYDYSQEGYYFITICTNNRENILSKIVYNEIRNEAKIQLTEEGRIIEKRIKVTNEKDKNIFINSYVIMPNHVHMIIENNGSSRAPTPTNSVIPKFVSGFKRLTNKEYEKNIWQRNYYEHIVRNEKEYYEIQEYIELNPLKWEKDIYFSI